MIKALLIDDEADAIELLKIKLGKHCADVKVVGSANNVKDAAKIIFDEKPDLVFLDINMPEINGIQFLAALKSRSFEVIFVTGNEEHRYEALNLEALHYLLKPIENSKLIDAVERFKLKKSGGLNQEKLDLVTSNLNYLKPISVSTNEGDVFINPSEIIYLEAASNYTDVYLNTSKPEKKKTFSKTLSDFEAILEKNNFLRCHKSFIVNMNYIKLYDKSGILKLETMLDCEGKKNEINVGDTYKDNVSSCLKIGTKSVISKKKK